MRWIVRPGDGSTVRDVLRRARADDDAVRDGRVFLGRRRVRRPEEPVRLDDVVDVAPRPDAPPAARILLQKDGVVAVDKPAGIPTIGDHAGVAHTLVAVTARALGIDPSRLHPTSRLDRDVSGIVLFTSTKAAAGRLARARATGSYERRYVAIAARAPEPGRGLWNDSIGRANNPRHRAVNGVDAVPAATLYAVCSMADVGAAMLGVAPVTGRTHQIRVHAAAAGAALVGDRVYGGPARLTLAGGRVLELPRIALHAARVAVPDARGATLTVASPVPDELAALWAALGGDPGAWEASTSCALD